MEDFETLYFYGSSNKQPVKVAMRFVAFLLHAPRTTAETYIQFILGHSVSSLFFAFKLIVFFRLRSFYEDLLSAVFHLLRLPISRPVGGRRTVYDISWSLIYVLQTDVVQEASLALCLPPMVLDEVAKENLATLLVNKITDYHDTFLDDMSHDERRFLMMTAARRQLGGVFVKHGIFPDQLNHFLITRLRCLLLKFQPEHWEDDLLDTTCLPELLYANIRRIVHRMFRPDQKKTPLGHFGYLKQTTLDMVGIVSIPRFVRISYFCKNGRTYLKSNCHHYGKPNVEKTVLPHLRSLDKETLTQSVFNLLQTLYPIGYRTYRFVIRYGMESWQNHTNSAFYQSARTHLLHLK
jgi:hypothetical protein